VPSEVLRTLTAVFVAAGRLARAYAVDGAPERVLSDPHDDGDDEGQGEQACHETLLVGLRGRRAAAGGT
jgi:hypothetical protein